MVTLLSCVRLSHLLTGVSNACAHTDVLVLMYYARKVSGCWERENPFLPQLLLYILLWCHGFLSSGEKGLYQTWYSRWNGTRRNVGTAVCRVLWPPSRRWWAATGSRKVSVARGCHPTQGSPVNKARHRRNTLPPFHPSLTAFLNLLSCGVPLGSHGAFHLARSGGGSPCYTQGKTNVVVCRFFSLWKESSRMRVEQMVVAASKESKDKWRNKRRGGRATLIRHHKSLFDWDTSKQKAVISSGISCYRKTSERLGNPEKTCPQYQVGLVNVPVPGMNESLQPVNYL